MARHTAPRKTLKSLNPFMKRLYASLVLKAWVNSTQANFLQSQQIQPQIRTFSKF
ncbi:hypothetical protein OUI_0799 [Helicobacter pylori R036d]|uniref:Uncharacterized protein n=1 Tax=Helicobacter pylori R036d TaxID=1145113 RepID=K2L793_HELPX|nr:hypothetical protein OUI_0799 [Helicobacter pylori R036d]